MKKDLGVEAALFPMPVLVVAAYNEDGTPNMMTAGWGMICDSDKIALFVDPDHKTMKNIGKMRAFTVSLADVDHMAEADFAGIASGNSMPDKFARSGLHAIRSNYVNAPVIEEFPVTMECELDEIVDNDRLCMFVGRIINTCADEKVIAEDGKVDPAKIRALAFDHFRGGYYVVGDKVGQGWNAGAKLMKE